jgi:hypothetical protein
LPCRERRFEFRERREQSLAEGPQIGRQLAVADQPELQPAAVAQHRDPEALLFEERQHRDHLEQARAEDVERERRSGDVGHDQVVGPQPVDHAAAEARQPGAAGAIGELGEQVDAFGGARGSRWRPGWRRSAAAR